MSDASWPLWANVLPVMMIWPFQRLLALAKDLMSIPNVYVEARLKGIQSALLAQHAGGRGLPSATIGSERETFLGEFLSKVFPAHHRFTRGAITDSNGQISGQIDIAVEFPFLPSFPMPASNERLMLAESVALAIEIKSNLMSQWPEVEGTTRALRPLQRRWLGGVELIGGTVNIAAASQTSIPLIAVGYTGHSTLAGLRQRLASTDEDARPEAAFVVESGCFVGFGLDAEGYAGFFSLCIAVSRLIAAKSSVAFDALEYVTGA